LTKESTLRGKALIKSIKESLGLHPNKYDEVITSQSFCASSFVALAQADKIIRQQQSSLCIICCLNLISVKSTAITARGAYTQTKPKPFGLERDGFPRTECVCTYILTSSEFCYLNSLPVLGKLRSVVGRQYQIDRNNTNVQCSAMRDALKKCDLHPHNISYVELHGAATMQGDMEEYKAFSDVYCVDLPRANDLNVGWLTATIGNPEVGFGLIGILKVLLLLTKGIIPGCMPPDAAYPLDPKCDVTSLSGVMYAKRTKGARFDGLDGSVFGAVHGFGVNGYAGHAIVQVDEEVRASWRRFIEISCFDSSYTISPTLEVLKTYSFDALAYVSDFSIKFSNGNQITWSEAVDLRLVGDISTIVKSTQTAVEIFPPGITKHAVGEGLNKAAIIVMCITRPSGVTEKEFVSKLKSKLKDNSQAKFLWWNNSTNQICFKADSF
jgi:hypothetical protein